MKDLSMHLRWEVGALDLLKVQEELLALQAGRSVHLPQEAGVLLASFMPVVAAIRLDMVASLVALAMGAAEVAAKSSSSLG
jgi:hypothetical protein